MPYKANEPRRHRIPKARYKIENWAEYDAALRRRGSLTVWVTPEAIAAWVPAQAGRRGRPKRYSAVAIRSEEHTSELQSRQYLVCRLLLEKKKNKINNT